MSESKKTSRRRGSGRRSKRTSEGLLLKGVDVAIIGAVFAVPFLIGGRTPVGEFVLHVSACIGSLCWAAHLIGKPEHGWISSKAEPLLIAIILVGLIQIAPLPAKIVESISPGVEKALPLWQAEAEHSVGEWRFLSLSPAHSRSSLPTGISLVLVFLVTVQRIRVKEDAYRIIRWVAVSGMAMSTFGIVQYSLANGKFYWIFKFRNISTADHLLGAFPNKNLFGEFIALTIGPMIWWLMVSNREPKKDKKNATWSTDSVIPQHIRGAALMLGLAVAVTALFLSLSRGAIISVGISISIMLLVLFRKQLVPGKTVVAFFGMSLLAVGLVFLVGGSRVTRAVGRLDNWNDSGRVKLWEANLKALNDFPVIGTGVGSHQYVYHRYFDTHHVPGTYSHAENSYIQIASECGLIGFGICVLALTLCFWWCARGVRLSQDKRATIALAAILCSLVGSCIHNLVDFGWYIQGTMSVFVVLMALACRLYQLERSVAKPETAFTPRRMPRPMAIGVATVVLIAGVWMLGTRAHAVAAYSPLKKFGEIRDAIDEVELTGDPVTDEKAAKYMMGLFRSKLLALHRAVKADPQNPELHYWLSRNYLVLFELLQSKADNAMTLGQLREVIAEGGFESQKEIDEWLGVAVGDNLKYAIASGKHAQRALQLNPLQANAYLQLAETGFLLGRKPGFERKCVAQALELWPYDGQVLFIAGRDAAIDGDLEKMMQFWKRAFNSKPEWQERIIQFIVAQVNDPVELMVAEFNPDVEALERITSIVERNGTPEERVVALTHFSKALVKRAQEEGNKKRMYDWLKAGTAFEKLGKTDQVTACLNKALKSEPSSFVVRFEFGVWLVRLKRYREALEHLEWCQLMKPDHPKLDRLLLQAKKGAYSTDIQHTGFGQSRSTLPNDDRRTLEHNQQFNNASGEPNPDSRLAPEANRTAPPLLLPDMAEGDRQSPRF